MGVWVFLFLVLASWRAGRGGALMVAVNIAAAFACLVAWVVGKLREQ